MPISDDNSSGGIVVEVTRQFRCCVPCRQNNDDAAMAAMAVGGKSKSLTAADAAGHANLGDRARNARKSVWIPILT